MTRARGLGLGIGLVVALVAGVGWWALARPHGSDTKRVAVAPFIVASHTGPITLTDNDIRDILGEAGTRHAGIYLDLAVDRFANGDSGNDTSGLSGRRDVTGFDPTDAEYFHGGDLAGITGQLDYLRGLGVTDLVLTPVFTPALGPDGQPVPLHYTDFLLPSDPRTLAPRYGTEDDLRTLASAVHDAGMTLILTLVVDPVRPPAPETLTRWLDLGVDGYRIRIGGDFSTATALRSADFLSIWLPAVRESARRAGHADPRLLVNTDRRDSLTAATALRVGVIPIAAGLSGAVSGYPMDSAAALHTALLEDSRLSGPGAGAVDSVLPSDTRWQLGDAGQGDEQQKLAAVQAQLALAYLLRGSPMVGSGVDQGLGSVNGLPIDQFATRDRIAAKLPVLGGPQGPWERYDPSHPLYVWMATLAALRRGHPALATGLTIERFSSRDGDQSPPNAYAFSRIDRATGTEYLVVLNPRRSRHALTLRTSSPSTHFTPVLGAGELTTDGDGQASIHLGAQPVRVLRADRPSRAGDPTISVSPQTDPLRATSLAVTAKTGGAPAETFVAVRASGQDWRVVGPVDHPPVQVIVPVDGIPAGSPVDVVALARTPAGRVAYAGARTALGAAPTGSTIVTAVGDFQKAAGCLRDDQPGCAATRMTGPDAQGRYTWTSPPLPEGGYHLRVSVGNGKPGTTAYGELGLADGDALEIAWADAGPLPMIVTFDPATRWIGLSLKGFGY